MSELKLRLFIAMPGTTMGESAEWKEPEKIKEYYYEKISERLFQKTGKEVELVIEKDKVRAGPIHTSMFNEAITADIYVADLTGNNANVYLELGARWALKDSVTIAVSQNVSDILFNAAASRAIQYGKDPDILNKAIDKTVEAIIEELSETDYCDSPVRQNSKIVCFDRGYIEKLKLENLELKKQGGKIYFLQQKQLITQKIDYVC